MAHKAPCQVRISDFLQKLPYHNLVISQRIAKCLSGEAMPFGAHGPLPGSFSAQLVSSVTTLRPKLTYPLCA